MRGRQTLGRAIQTYGRKRQIDKAIEEMAELTAALLHYRERGGSVDAVREEIADAGIMIDQLTLIFDGVEPYREQKLRRLRDQMGIPRRAHDRD